MIFFALQMLSKNDNGFFLMVEGAKIDKGHHEGRVSRAAVDVMITIFCGKIGVFLKKTML
jgi:alkaline phosphatase